MDLCNDFTQVSVNSTAGGTVVLSTAAAGRVPCLNRLEITVPTTNTLTIKSSTTTLLAQKFPAGGGPSWPMEPRVQGALRGKLGGNLQLSSPGLLDGFAIVSWTTQTAT